MLLTCTFQATKSFTSSARNSPHRPVTSQCLLQAVRGSPKLASMNDNDTSTHCVPAIPELDQEVALSATALSAALLGGNTSLLCRAESLSDPAPWCVCTALRSFHNESRLVGWTAQSCLPFSVEPFQVTLRSAGDPASAVQWFATMSVVAAAGGSALWSVPLQEAPMVPLEALSATGLQQLSPAFGTGGLIPIGARRTGSSEPTDLVFISDTAAHTGPHILESLPGSTVFTGRGEVLSLLVSNAQGVLLCVPPATITKALRVARRLA